jgi:hypothetical protein
MPAPLTLAKALQDAVVAFLSALPDLDGVTVIGRRKGNIVNNIEAAVAQLGACIYVFPALPVRVNPNLSGPFCDELSVRVRCIEMPVINTTRPDCYELAEIVLTQLHEADFSASAGLAGVNHLQCLPEPVEDVPDDKRVIFDVRFRTSCGLPAASA